MKKITLKEKISNINKIICCFENCKYKPLFEIHPNGNPYEATYSCGRHLNMMMDDYTYEHRIYHYKGE